MGAYLSAPVTDKFSSDTDNELMSVGSSSMQGWRRSQEDAHNVILDFDKDLKASLFAVYDGHGGAEVAIYCSEKLPVFLKSLDKFKEKNFHEALINAFIGLDDDILKEETMEILKKIASEKNPPIIPENIEDDDEEEEEDEEMGDDENLAELCQESRLPLHEVLLKYGRPKNKIIEKVEDAIEGGAPGGSGLNKKSKPLSPFLRGKRESREISSSEVCSSAAGSSSSTTSTSDDSAVSSSSQAPGPSKKSVENGSAEALPAKISEPKETNEVDSSSPDSSAGKKRNGSSSTEGQSSADVSSSSSSASTILNKENGEDYGIPSGAESVENIDSNDHEESSESEDDDFNASAELDNSDTDAEEMELEDEEDDEDDDEEEEGFDGVEEDGMIDVDVPGKDSGCTAVVALIVGKDLYVANAGDSRCVVCRNGKAIEMSLDHKPEDEEETKRIEKAGGKITLDGRVNGGLNLSRAIGDHTYKKNKSLPLEEQMISAMPDIRKIVITEEDEFMILACDGIWNFMSSEKVIQFVKERIDKGTMLMSQICEELFDVCLATDSKGDGTGCDNMTAVIVNFKDKILEQQTNLKPEEIETVFVVNKIENDTEEEEEDDEMDSTVEQSLTIGVTSQQAPKRSASPPNVDENGDIDSHNHKRLKTEENGSSSTADPDQSSINSTTTEGGSKRGVSLEGPQSSVTTTTNESDSST